MGILPTAGAGRQRWHRPVPMPGFGSAALLTPCALAVNVLGQSRSPRGAQMSSCTSLFHCPVADGGGVELHFGQLVFQGLFQSCQVPLPYQLPLCQTTASHSERTEIPEIFNFLQCCCQQAWCRHSQDQEQSFFLQGRSFFLISVPQLQGPR